MATVTYYFDNVGYSDFWSNPGNAVDGATGTYASTNLEYAYLGLDGTTCPGTDLGTIASARFRAYGYAEPGTDLIDSTNYNMWGLPSSAGWGSWLAWALVTYESLTWGNIPNITIGDFYTSTNGKTVYLARLEIEVTYTESGGGASVVPVIMAQYRQRRN